VFRPCRVHVYWRKARDEFADHYFVVDLNGIDFEWTTTGQTPRGCQFEVTVGLLSSRDSRTIMAPSLFLMRTRRISPSWHLGQRMQNTYTAIKVLRTKATTDSVFAILHIKKFIDIGLVPLSYHKYEEHADDDEDAYDAAAMRSGGAGKEQQQCNDDGDDYSDEEQPIDEEQEPVDEEQEQSDDEDNDEDTYNDMEDDDRKPAANEDMDTGYHKTAALTMEYIFDNDLTQSTIADEPSIVLPLLPPLPAASTLAQSVLLDTGNVSQSVSAISSRLHWILVMCTSPHRQLPSWSHWILVMLPSPYRHLPSQKLVLQPPLNLLMYLLLIPWLQSRPNFHCHSR
jgi:hypothetical protein